MDTVLLAKMNEYKKYSIMYEEIRKELEEFIINKYPKVESVYFGAYYIEITTQKHIMRMNEFSDLSTVKPDFICSGTTEMPKDIEEFLKMKEYVENDFYQCYSACNYLFFRYDFGLMKRYNDLRGL